jgi:hypothetical protein
MPELLDTLAEARYCAGDEKGALEAIDLAIKGAKESENPADLEYFLGQREKFLSKSR